MADLENGLFSGYSPANNPSDPTITDRFVTAIVKGGPNQWAIKGANAQSGGLSTFYNGVRPNAPGYNTMSKEGAIVLGIGGDNSNGAQGTFYEGVMTQGYPSDETEDAVQANVASAGYAATSLASGPEIVVGSAISFHATTYGYTDRYVVHNGNTVTTGVVSSSSDAGLQRSASWIVHQGFADSSCLSFESVDTAGSYIRHNNFVLQLTADDGSKQFREDATFCPQAGLTGQGNTIRAWGYPAKVFRHFNLNMYIASNGGVHDFDNKNSFNEDATWLVENAFASS